MVSETKGRNGEIQNTFWRKTQDIQVINWNMSVERNRNAESDTPALDLVNILMILGNLLKEGHFEETQVWK